MASTRQLYESVVKAAAHVFTKADEIYNVRILGQKRGISFLPFGGQGGDRGEPKFARLAGSNYASRYGTWQWDKLEQVKHYRGWVSKCVDFITNSTGVAPEIVRVLGEGERAAYSKSRQTGEGGRKFLSAISGNPKSKY